MPRRIRPQNTTRSEHWMRVAANEYTSDVNKRIIQVFDWDKNEEIQWLSPVISDEYAEYFDESFLEILKISNLEVPLAKFWPRSGARWDGLARTNSGKIILFEAKAYIEEGVDYRTKAKNTQSIELISKSINNAKSAFKADEDAPWETPFYQYTNRLAHLYFLHTLNKLDAYLVFLYFADAPDVPKPCSVAEWQGSIRLVEKCLGLGKHPYRNRVKTIIYSVKDFN